MGRTRSQRRKANKAKRAKAVQTAALKADPKGAPMVDVVDVEGEARLRVHRMLKATAPMAWYILRVYGAAGAMETTLRHHGFEVYAPRETLAGRRLGRPVRVVRPVFYGYLFVRIDREEQFDQVLAIEGGVVGWVKHCGTERKRMLRPWYVERMRLMEEFGLFDRRPNVARRLAKGDLVWMIGGAYCDHFAQVLQVKGGERRGELLLEVADFEGREVTAKAADVRAAWAGGDDPDITEAA